MKSIETINVDCVFKEIFALYNECWRAMVEIQEACSTAADIKIMLQRKHLTPETLADSCDVIRQCLAGATVLSRSADIILSKILEKILQVKNEID